jgi:hypothetical protein
MPGKRLQTSSSETQHVKDENLQINFHLQMMDYEWQRQDQEEMVRYGDTVNIPCDDLPFVHKVVCWVKSNGLSYESQDYSLREGCSFTYDVKQLSSKSVQFVDTIKLACFTKRPDMTKGPQQNAGDLMNMSRNNRDSYALLCAKHITIDDLLTNATGEDGCYVTMQHNFSHNQLRVRIKNASVCFAGTTYNNAVQYKEALRAANVDSFTHLCNSPMMNSSMMHSMDHRNKQMRDNLFCVGVSMAECCTIRDNSIGSMMHDAYTCGMLEGELKMLSDMGRFFKTDEGSVSPEWAAHNFAHACAVTGTQPHEPWAPESIPVTARSSSLSGIYEPVRKLTSAQIITLLHTTLCIPYFSSDITPYISDGVCMPTLEQVNMMVQQTAQHTDRHDWPEAAFEMTECIDNAMSVPNDFFFRGADCEGGSAMHCKSYRNICSLYSITQSLLQDLSTPEKRQKLSDWVCATCNTVIPKSQHYAFAVQIAVVSGVAQYAGDCSVLLCGAQSASPLDSPEMKKNTQEGGHSTCALQIMKKHCEEIAARVYAAHTNNLYTKPYNISKLSKSPKTSIRMEHAYSELTSCGTISTESCVATDILENKSFYILETTTAISRHSLTGVISADLRVKTPNKCDTITLKVPFTQYVQQMEMSLLNKYMTDAVNMRVQGFNTKDPDATVQPPFYSSFYQMDEYMLNEFQEKKYYTGTSANSFLYHKDAHMTIEKTPMPLLDEAQKKIFDTDMEKQWEETRLPTVGRKAVATMLAQWHPAPATPVHCPENIEKQLYRCNVTLSGVDGKNFLRNHQKDIACENSQLVANKDGLFADVHVFSMGENTVIVSQALRMDRLRAETKSA